MQPLSGNASSSILFTKIFSLKYFCCCSNMTFVIHNCHQFLSIFLIILILTSYLHRLKLEFSVLLPFLRVKCLFIENDAIYMYTSGSAAGQIPQSDEHNRKCAYIYFNCHVNTFQNFLCPIKRNDCLFNSLSAN